VRQRAYGRTFLRFILESCSTVSCTIRWLSTPTRGPETIIIVTVDKVRGAGNKRAKTKGHLEFRKIILVVNDVEETRDGLEELLIADGYDVDQAKNEYDAVHRGRANPPDLILLSLSGGRNEWIAAATSIRKKANLKENTPIVLFCVEDLSEGAEVELEGSIYLIRPDDFNQLRNCLERLLVL
jgi:CheY-like chemotaxis protein